MTTQGETKWTRGPWMKRVTKRHISVFQYAGSVIARLPITTDSARFENGLADARLIAAAPELYDALADMLSYETDAPLVIQDKGNAALSKARGE